MNALALSPRRFIVWIRSRFARRKQVTSEWLVPYARAVVVLLAAPLSFSGCVGPARTPLPLPTGDPVIDGRARISAAPFQDRVLWQYRIASAAMRRGDFDEAARLFDEALTTTAGILADAGSGDAARARRMFRSESEKSFVGEPYERAMASFYRGVLYWRRGEPDNARALFRNTAFIDGEVEDAAYASDYVLPDYLDGLIAQRLGGDGEEARLRAARRSAFELPAYDPDNNVMVFVEYGRGPRKVASGPDGERLSFRAEPSPVVRARLSFGERVVDLPPYDDLQYQATTRGGRVMDYILGNKAVFKRNTEAFGDLALSAAGVVAADGHHRPRRGRTPEEVEKDRENAKDRENTAIALAVAGIFSKLASAATQSSADTRTWDNLPQYLSFAALRLPPGEHQAVLEFFDESDRPLDDRTQRFVVEVPVPSLTSMRAVEDVVIFRSELPR